MLGVDISGQDELLRERKEAKAKLQNMGTSTADVVNPDVPAEDVPDTTLDDITDPTLKSILTNE